MKKVYINAYTEDDEVTIGIRSEVYFDEAAQEEGGYYQYFTDTCPLPFDLVYAKGSLWHGDECLGPLPLSTSFDTPHIHVIEDWTGKRLFPEEEFDSYEAGWAFVDENIQEEYENDGTYDDIYVGPKTKKHG